MADVEVTYNNNKIVELSESGIKTLKTAGKYLEDDIVLEYVRSTDNNYIVIASIAGVTLTCGNQSYTLGSNETMHAFSVASGTYTCTASKTGYSDDSGSVTISSGFEYITLTPIFLPVAYQWVEYLVSEANGAYIDTGIASTVLKGFDTKIRLNSTTANDFMAGFGCNSSSSGNIYVAATPSDSVAISIRGLGGKYTTTGVDHVITFVNNTLSVDGVVMGSATYTAGDSTTLKLFVFGTAALNQQTYTKIYYFKVYDSSRLIRDLYPCYRKSDKVLGMYDKVSGTFFTNSGTGIFTAGPDVD